MKKAKIETIEKKKEGIKANWLKETINVKRSKNMLEKRKR